MQKIAQKIDAQIIPLNELHMYECTNITDNDYRTNGHTVKGCSFLALKTLISVCMSGDLFAACGEAITNPAVHT